jgi:poly(A) polymerase
VTLRDTALDIVLRLQDAGFVAYWVGGCVRDQWLGQEPEDYDVATSARPEQIERLFPKTFAVGKQFGVIIAVEQDHHFQIATFRAESDYQDGRHPSQVTFSDAQADARRRDFTINGLFYDPVRQQLFDWVGGEADLRKRIVRTIGPPQDRFSEDHLRLLRAVRFAAQLDFEIDPETLAAVQANAGKILTVSAERVREELIRLFRPEHAGRGLDLLQESGLLQQILPEIAATSHCEQSSDYHPEGSVYNHIRLMLSLLPADASASLPWTVLLHDIGKVSTSERDPATGSIHFYGHEKVSAEIAENLLQRLKFPRKQMDEIIACVRQHMQFKDVPQMRKATLRRLLLRPTFPLELELHRLDCLGSHNRLDNYQFLVNQAEQLKQQPSIRPPLITGDDLLALGLKTSPAVGALLAEIREKQLQDELKTREEALTWAIARVGESRDSGKPNQAE